jgi:hypothetical protein
VYLRDFAWCAKGKPTLCLQPEMFKTEKGKLKIEPCRIALAQVTGKTHLRNLPAMSNTIARAG